MTPDGVIKDLPDTWDAHDPTWSPDGREIAYGHPDGLFVIRPDGSGPRQLTPGDIYVQDPQYSPDGRQIAFCRSELVGSKVEYSLNVIGRDGSGMRIVAPVYCLDVSWSPDGTRLVFGDIKDGSRLDDNEIAVINLDGTGRRVIASGFPVLGGAFQPIPRRAQQPAERAAQPRRWAG